MPEEKDIATLLKILRDAGQTDEARQKALQQLEAGEAEVQAVLRKEFTPEPAQSEADTVEIHNAYNRLRAQLEHSHSLAAEQKRAGTRISVLRTWLSAAAIVLFCLVAVWLLLPKANQPAILTAETPLAPTPAIKFDTIRNKHNQEYTYFHLPDGSAVRLDPNSSVRFLDSFSAHKKEVFMEGNALFSIQKESSRPFSVFVNGMEILDLGTKFSVNTNKSIVRVRLIRGKVLIRSVNPAWKINNIILKPGQEFSVDTLTRKYAVQFIIPQDEILPAGKLNKELVFANASLQEVFERLTKEGGINIHYYIGDIQDMAFTGTFNAGADTKAIIDRICLLNDLKYKISDNSIYIRK